MWRRQPQPGVLPKKIVDRVAALPTPDLIQWADQALYTTGRSLTSHMREHSPDMISEAVTGAQVLLAITEEIRRRSG